PRFRASWSPGGRSGRPPAGDPPRSSLPRGGSWVCEADRSQARRDTRTRNGTMRTRMHLPLAASLLLVTGTAIGAGEGYLLHPAISGDRIVFTSEEDLWTVPVEGGVARRLTRHAGLEASARFSPDGKSIAFSAEYGGNTDVYVMPRD